MSISLYLTSVESYKQGLAGLVSVLQKAADFSAEKGIDADTLLEQSLADDMLPLSFQLNSARHHSLGCIEGIKAGVFSPPPQLPAMSFADFQNFIQETLEKIEALSEAEVNELAGKAMKFKMKDFEMPFSAENFVLSFSLPNFYFHTTTAYDILRKQGVPLGKMNYLGPVRKDQ